MKIDEKIIFIDAVGFLAAKDGYILLILAVDILTSLMDIFCVFLMRICSLTLCDSSLRNTKWMEGSRRTSSADPSNLNLLKI